VEIPNSSYIFSQAVANLQASLVKHYNWKYQRIGALFARRFEKFIIKDEKDFEQWTNHFLEMKKVRSHFGHWKARKKAKTGMRKEKGYLISSKYFYRSLCKMHPILENFLLMGSSDLQGQLKPIILNKRKSYSFRKIRVLKSDST
jgi:hypothetical protein